jgi:tRNA(His) 5'-end guanylyltransferase
MLQGTLTQDKNELLFTQFDINYSTLPARFRKVCWHDSGRLLCCLAPPCDMSWTDH